MLRIVTDGAADMPPEWEKEFDIQVIPINIQFGEKTYLQYVDLDNAGFYKMVDETKTIPKTSQPSPHQFAEFYKKIAKKGDTIISIQQVVRYVCIRGTGCQGCKRPVYGPAGGFHGGIGCHRPDVP
jgi:hypothetical protein